MIVLLNISPSSSLTSSSLTFISSSLTYVNPESFHKGFFQLCEKPSWFVCFEAGFYLLHLVVPSSGPRRDDEQLISHLLSPDNPWARRLLLYTASLIVFFPRPKALLIHSLSESCPYLQSSLLLFEIFPVSIRAVWEQGARTALTPPGTCTPFICRVVYRCPKF